MKSGSKAGSRLVGPGSNDYGRNKPTLDPAKTAGEISLSEDNLTATKVITELTPELTQKIYDNITQKMHDEKASKDIVLHHLKQLKAQMGKLKNEWLEYGNISGALGVNDCMEMIDKKIEKINKL